MAKPKPRKIFVSLTDYCALISRLAQRINTCDDFRVRQVVAIARGGLFPGEVLSRCLKVPLAVISVGSYPDKKTQQQQVAFSRDLTTKGPLRRSGVLLVDELTENGLTMAETVAWLRRWYGLRTVRTAVVWHKTKSVFVPDIYAELVEPDSSTGLHPWFVTPQEQTELWLPRP